MHGQARGEEGAKPPGFVKMKAGEYASDRFVVDLRYDTDDNFLGRNVYRKHGVSACWLHPVAADRLMKLVPELKRRRMKLVLWDCWRPLEVQREMWKIMPDPRYVADPEKGSKHNRGIAVDASLADEGGNALPMPTAFDDFSERASPAASCSKEERGLCANRDLQIRLMRKAGFEVLPTEWWHYEPRGVEASLFPVR